MKIKAIVFDCFGVLVGHGYWDIYEMAGGNLSRDRGFVDEQIHAANSGLITSAQLSQNISQKLGMTESEWSRFVDEREKPNESLFHYIQTILKPSHKIGLLSNAGVGVVERKIPANLLSLFDAVVVSGEVGYMKPDRQIYTIAHERLDVLPDEVVFVDDVASYLEGARSVGMHTIHYKDRTSLQQELEQILK